MVKEIDWQAKLVKRLKAEGGYARKASSTYAVGVLDLDVCNIVFVNCKVEVKLEKDLKPGWKRTLDYTERQKEEAEDIIKGGGNAIGLTVLHYNPNRVYLHVHTMPIKRQFLTLTEHDHLKEATQWMKTNDAPYLTRLITRAVLNLRSNPV